MNALQQLNNLPERKEQIKTFAQAGIDEILNGNYSALEFKLRADFIKKALDQILDHAVVNDLVLHEARKYEGQDYKNCKVSVISKKTWNYDQCNDNRYDDIKTVLEKAKADLKNQEDFLKTLTFPIADLDGNIINPPTFTETEYITIK